MNIRRSQSRFVLGTVIVLVVVLALTTGYFYARYAQLKKNPSSANAATATKVINDVSKLYILPKGQTPTVAKIVNVKQLDSQAFFKSAKDGDQLLIYTKASLAIVYRPSTNMIINAGPISQNSGSTASAPTTSPAGTTQTAPVKPVVVVLNGSDVNGEAVTVGSEINSKLSSTVSVSSSYGNATIKEAKSLVVALNSSDASAATQVANAIGGTVGSLPTGQAKPNSGDILVITGP